MKPSSLMACPDCDLLCQSAAVPKHETAICPRCGATLARGGPGSLDRPLVLAFVALLLFFIANAFPLMVVDFQGASRGATLPGCASAVLALGWPWLAAILLTTVILAPPAYLAGLIFVLFQARRRRAQRLTHRWTTRSLRIIQEVEPWGLTGVFLLGILVAYVKLGDSGEVTPGPGLYALAGFTITMAALATAMDAAALWDALEDRS